MKQLLLAFLIFGASPVFGDDMALAKATFEKFDQLQKANDLKATTLLSEDCEGKLIQSDGEMEIAVDVPKGQFAKFIELAVQEEKKKKDLYEDVEFAASGDAIEASGFIRYADPAFRGPFAMEFGKNPAGEMKITFMTITVPLLSTPIKSEGVFEFVMPGKWSPGQIKKSDLGEGKAFQLGNAGGPGISLAYFAFDDSKETPAEQDPTAFPSAVSEPIAKKLVAQGGKELSFDTLDLIPGNKDQAYFIRVLLDPAGKRVFIHGVVIRGKEQMYVIQTVGSNPPNVKMWRKAAKSFKEL